MIEIPRDTSRTVLLMGAGLSRNWGARLASEIWTDLIGHPAVREDASARAALLANQNYERLLEQAAGGEHGPTAYATIERAVYDAFVAMDRQLAQHRGPNVHRFQELLRLNGAGRKTAFGFSLNQDLLLERIFYNHHDGSPPCGLPHHPGVHGVPDAHRGSNLGWFQPNDAYWLTREFGTGDERGLDVGLPDGDVSITRSDLEGRWNYIKLHGSFNWLYQNGRRALVMGGDKVGQIGSSGLLSTYFEIFRSVLNSGNVNLIAIGYGFADEHINRVIAEAAANHDMHICVWNPSSPADIFALLAKTSDGEAIKQAIRDYETRTLLDVLPPSGDRLAIMDGIKKRFFGIT